MIDIVVAGHACVDIIPHILPGTWSASCLMPGRLTEVGGAMFTAGGAVSNTGLALHKLGMDVRLVARVGDDIIGDLLHRIIASVDPRLTESLVTAQGESGSFTLVISPPGVDRCFLTGLGTNDTFGPEDVPDELLARTRVFHFGYPPLLRRMYRDHGQDLTELYRKAKRQGATTSLDLAMPDPAQPSGQANWRDILSHTLPYVDVFAPSAEELLFMLDRARFDALEQRAGEQALLDLVSVETIASLADDALSFGAQIVMIKLGHRGIYLRTGELETDWGRGAPADLDEWRMRELWAPAFVVNVVGTVGAGDATVAGFLTAILRGQGPEDAIGSAAAVGACNVEAADAMSGLLTWEQTQARLASPWPQRDPAIAARGWQQDEARGLWRGPLDRS
jgi:sugar/nucleoside kinase (ribokinase family)